MKLTVDFSALRAAVKRMGAKPSEFDFVAKPTKPLELDFDLALSAGIQIDLDDLESHGGLLGYKGRQVLLYIPDQSGAFDKVIENGGRGKRFHVADCKTLQEMKRIKRFDRYDVANGTTGVFNITGFSSSAGEKATGEAQLKVCKNCLSYLNYKGYKTGPDPKSKTFKSFQLAEFFARHSTIFKHVPSQLRPITSGYSDDWASISKRYRAGQGYQCEQCSVGLADYKNLLHCHHVSGVKSDNSPSNLKALCIDCHRKQPMHEHMHINAQDMLLINKLRRDQGMFDDKSWDIVLELADTSFHGLLLNYRAKGLTVPEVGYDVQNDRQEVIASLEVAWPKNKRGVAIESIVPKTLKPLGWDVRTLNEAVAANAQ